MLVNQRYHVKSSVYLTLTRSMRPSNEKGIRNFGTRAFRSASLHSLRVVGMADETWTQLLLRSTP
jgi:hypothetical protein